MLKICIQKFTQVILEILLGLDRLFHLGLRSHPSFPLIEVKRSKVYMERHSTKMNNLHFEIDLLNKNVLVHFLESYCNILSPVCCGDRQSDLANTYNTNVFFEHTYLYLALLW